jgi:large repetitive protein
VLDNCGGFGGIDITKIPPLGCLVFRKRLVLIGIPLVAASCLSGCGGKVSGSGGSGSSSSGGPTSVSIAAPSSSVDGLDSITLTATVANDSHADGVTWSLTGAGTLSNETTTSATYTAPAATSSAQQATVTAVSVKETTKFSTTALTVPAVPVVTTPSSALAGSVGTTYSVQLTGSGGIGPYNWTVASGYTLPAGLSLSAAGVLSGTPMAVANGTTNIVFQMTDAGTPTPLSATRVLGISIAAAPAITFAGAMPATGSLEQAYTGSAAATGGAGALTYSLSTGALPTGLSLNAVNGSVTGTATAGGTYNFAVKAADAFGDSATQTYQIVVNSPLLNITPGPGSLPVAVTGQAYSQTLTVVGGTGTGYVWTVSGLSNGLTSSASGGTLTISGPATTAGTVNFTASAKDSAENLSSIISYSIQVYGPVTLPLTIPATLPSAATFNTAYSGTVAASGGSGNYTWNVTGQADGLTASSNGGTLTVSGTPTAKGTVSLNVSVKDVTTGSTAGPYIYAITVYDTVTLPAPDPSTLGPATLSLPYSGTIVASGGSGSYSWTVTGLPSDSLNYSAGGGTLTISGTPTSAATVSFGVMVKDNLTNISVGPYTYTVTVDNSLTLPPPNPASLGPADVGSNYSGTITVAGGSGNYSWTVSSLSDGLSAVESGSTLTVSGSPTSVATVSFNVSVKDNSTNTTVGPYTYTITVNSALALPTPNPASLPAGYPSVPYTGTISASGGSGSYSWVVTGLSDNLSASPSGGTLTINGTPGTTAATVTFNVALTDTKTNASITQNGYSIAFNPPAPLTLPVPNPATLPSAVTNELYAGSIVATGGVPPYTWSVNGVSIPNTGAAVIIADGISVSSNGSNILSVGGTPTAIQTVNLTNVQVMDHLGTNQSNSYTIAVNRMSQVSGQISLNGVCGAGSPSVPTITVNLLTSPGGTVVQTVTTDGSGNFVFPGVLAGNYTIAPSISGPSSVFYPSTQSVTVLNTDSHGENFAVALGYTVSGTVSYSGSNTGQIYLSLVTSSNCGSGGVGTSIFTPGAFTIRGVPPGAYTLQAWMDLAALANGAQNTSDPSGNVPVTVAAANVTGTSVTVTDNTPTSVPSSNPTINAITSTDQGVTISYKPITSNSVEAATSYDVQWSTSSTFSSTTTYNFKAVGTGSDVWILNNGTSDLGGSPFTNGQTYYFEVRARNAAGPASGWTVYGGTTPIGVTAGASTSGNEVQGTVTIPAGTTPTGPLYVGYYNQSTNTVYATRIASPGSSNPFTVYVPTDTNNDFIFFEILDQNNDGLIDARDVSNTSNNSSGIPISGPLTGQNLTLATANSTATVATEYYQTTGQAATASSGGYDLNFDVREGNKLPVAVTLLSGPNVINPVDISNYCPGCGSVQFQYHVPVNVDTPTVGDTYSLQVTYSDSSSDTETLTGAVTGWNGTSSVVGPNNLATGLSPNDQTSLQPSFSWSDPSADSTDLFSFYLANATGNTIWQIPGSNSNSSGFSSSIVFLNWGMDPTDPSNVPTVPGLTDTALYTWGIQAQDSYGNQALTVQVFQASGEL